MRSIASSVMFHLPRRSHARRAEISAGKALGEWERRALSDLGEATRAQVLLDDRGSRGFGGAGRAFSGLRSLIRNLSSESDHGDVVELAAAGGMGANSLDEHLAGGGRARGCLGQHAVEPGVAE